MSSCLLHSFLLTSSAGYSHSCLGVDLNMFVLRQKGQTGAPGFPGDVGERGYTVRHIITGHGNYLNILTFTLCHHLI